MAGAAAALAGVILVGARKGKYGPNGEVNAIPGANLPSGDVGHLYPLVRLVWFQWWFGAGYCLGRSANAVAVVFMNTNLAAAGGCIAAL